MSVTSIPVAAFRYTADGAQAVSETARVREAVERLNETPLSDLTSSFFDLDLSVSGLAQKAIGLVSVGALAGLAKQGIDLANEIKTAADRAGTTAEQLSKLKFAAEESDVSFEALTTGIKKFQEGISQAAIGQGGFASALAEIGVSAANFKGLALENQLGLVAEGFAKVADQNDRVRISQDLFGRSSSELILLLGQGKEGLEALTNRAEELGLVLDNRATAAVDRNSKALERFFNILKTGSANIVGGFLANVFGSGDEIADAEAKIEQIKRDRDSLQRGTAGEFVGAVRVQVDRFNREIEALEARIKKLQALKLPDERDAFRRSPAGLADIGLPSDPRFDSDDDLRKGSERAAEEKRKQDERLKDDMISQQEKFNDLFESEQIRIQESVSDNLQEEVERRNEIERNGRERILQQEQAFQDQILSIRRQGVNAAQILLTAYGGKFAAVAKAILLIEKVNAIKSTFINTREAIMKTFAKYGATPIGYASAAAIAVLGAAQIAAIGAQGTSSSGSGGGLSGGGLSGGANGGGPQFDPVSDPSQPFVNNAPQTATQIIIQGSVFSSRETADFIIQQIREAVDKRDVVIIGNDSRQAQEIMRG